MIPIMKLDYLRPNTMVLSTLPIRPVAASGNLDDFTDNVLTDYEEVNS